MHNTGVVSHLVSVRASSGRSAQVGLRLGRLIEPSLGAAGCLQFNLQKSMTDKDLWVVNGTWADTSAMNDWFATPELDVFSDLVMERLVSSLDFQTFASVAVPPTLR